MNIILLELSLIGAIISPNECPFPLLFTSSVLTSIKCPIFPFFLSISFLLVVLPFTYVLGPETRYILAYVINPSCTFSICFVIFPLTNIDIAISMDKPTEAMG